MGPIWVVPIIVSIFVILWKFPIIRRSSNKIGHLLDLGSYVGAAFLLYGLLFWLGVEITKWMTWVTYGPIIHVGTIIAFLTCYVILLIKIEGRTKKAGPMEIETLVRGMDRMYGLLKKTEKSYGDLSEMLGEAAEKIDGAVERQSKEIEVLKETVAIMAKMHREDSDEMKKAVEKQRKNTEALRDEVKTFRGAKAEKKGHEWEDVIAEQIKRLGFKVESGKARGQPDIIIKNSEGNAVGVVGCKSYKLRSTRGMSNRFNPEIEFAGEEGVPLVVAIQNRLNNLEFFKVYKQDELINFTCSTPTWLAGEVVGDKDRDEEAKSRREFRGFLTEIS